MQAIVSTANPDFLIIHNHFLPTFALALIFWGFGFCS